MAPGSGLSAQLPSTVAAPESAKEAVENALDNDDIAPLVRMKRACQYLVPSKETAPGLHGTGTELG